MIGRGQVMVGHHFLLLFLLFFVVFLVAIVGVEAELVVLVAAGGDTRVGLLESGQSRALRSLRRRYQVVNRAVALLVGGLCGQETLTGSPRSLLALFGFLLLLYFLVGLDGVEDFI
jgi:hypothetical protein